MAILRHLTETIIPKKLLNSGGYKVIADVQTESGNLVVSLYKKSDALLILHMRQCRASQDTNF